MFVQTADDLGRMLREARLRRGLSQRSLAAQFGTSQSWVSEVENGKETAELGMILRALAYLGLTLEVTDRDTRSPGQVPAGQDDDPAERIAWRCHQIERDWGPASGVTAA